MSPDIVGVAGLGFLGRGIVACLAAYGRRVIAYGRSAQSHRETVQYANRAMQELVAYAGFPTDLPDVWQDRVQFVDQVAPLGEAQFVIESVTEDVAVKSALFDALEDCVAPTTPIATNTSSLPVSVVAAGRRVSERFLGMHWAEPAYATRFLELIRGEQTSDDAFQQAVELARSCGKQPSIIAKDVAAFVANRIGYAMFREALNLLDQGVADAATIDRSFRNSVGLWASFAGPFRWIDLTGGPALYGKTMENVWPTLSNAAQVPRRVRELMQQDARGVANRRGFFSYTDQDVEKWEERFRETVWKVRQWGDQLHLGDD